jgi:hypothetical protein
VGAPVNQPVPKAGDEAPEDWFRFFGMVVIRKTDLLAGVAFVLAVTTTAYQLASVLSGANPVLYHPETVYIFFDTSASQSTSTRVAGQVAFTNNADVGRSGIVKSVSVAINIGTKTIQQPWLSFAKMYREGTVLHLEPKEFAHPLVIAGGSAASEMIAFASRVRDCVVHSAGQAAKPCEPYADYLSDDQFISAMMTAEAIELKFIATLFDSSKKLESTCLVPMTSRFKAVMAANEWISATCFTKPQSGAVWHWFRS